MTADNPTTETSDAPPAGWTQLEARAFNAVQPALTKAGQWLPLSVRRAVANAILAELKQELDAYTEYENAINWMTTCMSCARMLDASHRELERAEKAEAEVAAARKFAEEMRDFCSPHGVSVHYADQLEAAMDRAKEGQS